MEIHGLLAELDRALETNLEQYLGLRAQVPTGSMEQAIDEMSQRLGEFVQRMNDSVTKPTKTQMRSYQTANLALIGAQVVLRRFLEHDIQANTEG